MPEDTQALPSHISAAIQKIADLHAQHHRRATSVERLFRRSMRVVSQPRFAGFLCVFVVLWMVVNSILWAQSMAFDPPPFDILQNILGPVDLFLTVLILITQRRDGEIEEIRDQLSLELAILNEQKSAKIIELLEEMRRDSPALVNRIDLEATALSVPADPAAVSDAIVNSHKNMKLAVGSEQRQKDKRDSK